MELEDLLLFQSSSWQIYELPPKGLDIGLQSLGKSIEWGIHYYWFESFQGPHMLLTVELLEHYQIQKVLYRHWIWCIERNEESYCLKSSSKRLNCLEIDCLLLL